MLVTKPISYMCIQYSSLTDAILDKCSILFNNHYGTWSQDASIHSKNTIKSVTRVRLGVKRLRKMFLFNDRLIGNAVVSSSYRGQGMAERLLSNAKNSVEDVVCDKETKSIDQNDYAFGCHSNFSQGANKASDF